jgi:hypothetical protein
LSCPFQYLSHVGSNQSKNDKLDPGFLPGLGKVMRIGFDCGNTAAIEPALELLKFDPQTDGAKALYRMITKEIYEKGWWSHIISHSLLFRYNNLYSIICFIY